MEEKRRQLAGQLRFRLGAIRKTTHGGLSATLHLDDDQFPNLVALDSMGEVNFSCDVFELENETFGGEKS